MATDLSEARAQEGDAISANGTKDKINAPLRGESFLVMAYPGPPIDQVNLSRFCEIAEAGIDIIAPANGTWDKESTLKVLDLADEVGIRVITTDMRVLPWHLEDRVEIDQQNIEDVTADYRNHPALFGYFICDEPHADYFEELASTSKRMRLADPHHLPLINLFPSYGSPLQLGFDDFRAYVRSFVEIVKPEILSYDHYPLWTEQIGRTTDWYGDLAIFREESRRAGIPFMICLQSEGLGEALRVPNRSEVLWQASTVLAYGARGVTWFTYWTPPPMQTIPLNRQGEGYLVEEHFGGMLTQKGERTPLFDHVREANQFLHEAGNALSGWDNAHVAQWANDAITGNGQSPCVALRGKDFSAVVGTFSHGDLRRIVIANDSYTSEARFTIEPQDGWALSRVVATQGATQEGQSNTPLEWQLAPGGCVVIECSR